MSQTSKNRVGLVFLSIFCIALISTFDFTGQSSYTRSDVQVATSTPQESMVASTTATLSFVGDIMLDRGVKMRVQKQGGGDYNFLFENAEFLKTPDLMFANLEGPVSDRGQNVGSIYSFRFEPVVLDALHNAGFDVLSMANNHIGDWTKLALEDTLTLGRAAGFDMVGGGTDYQDAITPDVHVVNGITIAYLGFSDFGPAGVLLRAPAGATSTASGSTNAGPGILSASDPLLPAIIRDASEQVDILVVSFHFGDEYKARSNARQQRLAHLAIDNGADIVVGHHPHVRQETEEYKGKLIAYSLGNFIFDQNFSEETMRGMKLDALVNKEGVVSYSTSTIQLNSNYQPSMVE